jgi:hypothetical protein
VYRDKPKNGSSAIFYELPCSFVCVTFSLASSVFAEVAIETTPARLSATFLANILDQCRSCGRYSRN